MLFFYILLSTFLLLVRPSLSEVVICNSTWPSKVISFEDADIIMSEGCQFSNSLIKFDLSYMILNAFKEKKKSVNISIDKTIFSNTTMNFFFSDTKIVKLISGINVIFTMTNSKMNTSGSIMIIGNFPLSSKFTINANHFNMSTPYVYQNASSLFTFDSLELKNSTFDCSNNQIYLDYKVVSNSSLNNIAVIGTFANFSASNFSKFLVHHNSIKFSSVIANTPNILVSLFSMNSFVNITDSSTFLFEHNNVSLLANDSNSLCLKNYLDCGIFLYYQKSTYQFLIMEKSKFVFSSNKVNTFYNGGKVMILFATHNSLMQIVSDSFYLFDNNSFVINYNANSVFIFWNQNSIHSFVSKSSLSWNNNDISIKATNPLHVFVWSLSSLPNATAEGYFVNQKSAYNWKSNVISIEQGGKNSIFVWSNSLNKQNNIESNTSMEKNLIFFNFTSNNSKGYVFWDGKNVDSLESERNFNSSVFSFKNNTILSNRGNLYNWRVNSTKFILNKGSFQWLDNAITYSGDEAFKIFEFVSSNLKIANVSSFVFKGNKIHFLVKATVSTVFFLFNETYIDISNMSQLNLNDNNFSGNTGGGVIFWEINSNSRILVQNSSNFTCIINSFIFTAFKYFKFWLHSNTADLVLEKKSIFKIDINTFNITLLDGISLVVFYFLSPIKVLSMSSLSFSHNLLAFNSYNLTNLNFFSSLSDTMLISDSSILDFMSNSFNLVGKNSSEDPFFFQNLTLCSDSLLSIANSSFDIQAFVDKDLIHFSTVNLYTSKLAIDNNKLKSRRLPAAQISMIQFNPNIVKNSTIIVSENVMTAKSFHNTTSYSIIYSKNSKTSYLNNSTFYLIKNKINSTAPKAWIWESETNFSANSNISIAECYNYYNNNLMGFNSFSSSVLAISKFVSDFKKECVVPPYYPTTLPPVPERKSYYSKSVGIAATVFVFLFSPFSLVASTDMQTFAALRLTSCSEGMEKYAIRALSPFSTEETCDGVIYGGIIAICIAVIIFFISLVISKVAPLTVLSEVANKVPSFCIGVVLFHLTGFIVCGSRASHLILRFFGFIVFFLSLICVPLITWKFVSRRFNSVKYKAEGFLGSSFFTFCLPIGTFDKSIISYKRYEILAHHWRYQNFMWSLTRCFPLLPLFFCSVGKNTSCKGLYIFAALLFFALSIVLIVVRPYRTPILNILASLVYFINGLLVATESSGSPKERPSDTSINFVNTLIVFQIILLIMRIFVFLFEKCANRYYRIQEEGMLWESTASKDSYYSSVPDLNAPSLN